MSHKNLQFWASLTWVLMVSACSEAPEDRTISSEERQLKEIHDGNIAYHVPSKAHFKEFLERDLKEYFNTKFDGSHISYELLRDMPTQTGVGFPHYYIWVKIIHSQTHITQGAIRLSAMDGTSFLVSDYISAEKIRANPDLPDQIFPASLCDDIRERAIAAGRN